MKIDEEKLPELYALSKFAVNGLLAVLASIYGLANMLPFRALVLFFPIGGVFLCFFLFRYVLNLRKKSVAKMLLLSGSFSSWAFFIVLWILSGILT